MNESNGRQYEKTEMGRDMRVESESSDKYDTLVQSEDSPFYGEDRKDLFVFAMGYGRKKAGRREVESANHALFNLSSLSESQHWVIKSVAVKHTNSAQVLRDEVLVYQIAQEYAKAGLNELHSKYLGPTDMFTELTQDIAKFNEGEQ